MPANLTPQYQRAELAFRRAGSTPERLAALEAMLQLVPKHKGTEKLQADLKTRLKELRRQLTVEQTSPVGGGRAYRLARQGAATLVILGPPNVGKSRLLRALTSAEPEVADYPFTTREPLPGMLPWEDIAFQLVDTPPLTTAGIEPGLLNLIRAADGVILVCDGRVETAIVELESLRDELTRRHTRLSARTGLAEDDLAVVELRTLLVGTHGDMHPAVNSWSEELVARGGLGGWLTVDLAEADHLEPLRRAIVQTANVLRVYTKTPGQPVTRTAPLTFAPGATVADVAAKLHEDLERRLKTAKVWSTGAMAPKTVGRDHVLTEGDLVELQT